MALTVSSCFAVLCLFAVTNAVNLGDSCLASSECNYIVNAECRDSICQCISSTVTYQGSCVQAVEPATTCTLDSECKTVADPYRICVNGSCTCIPYYNFFESTCRKNKGLYEYCLADSDCYMGEDLVGKMACTANKCACKTGYITSGKKCL